MSVLKHVKEVTPAEEFETTQKEYLEETQLLQQRCVFCLETRQ